MSSNENELDEILEKKFKRVIVSIVNETKEDRNRFLNELQENTKKQLKEIKKPTQNIKVGFNNEIEIIKNITLKNWK